ncbi:GntR family transcriptional regulator [Cryobacterium psychrophilum]|uniref:GntR family transcriptional regulator n=1 Tax=Cryobacterium psychrophilum TaxID=41988 RepID=A0A4Y8KLR5_9MICO|nr:GntR family transcriptional regulator [Cryobacterium psychrophilum]TDW30622.1 GntR family transcriptional regulator [Cryobacterium psychrophilum]TFD77043.1 GntR family transcriptional regulator [Cryobacterium psychrophilum]
MATDTVAAPPVGKAQIAYDWLKTRVNDGTFGPGYRLVLDQIGREISMSPVPVREAIRRLEAEGLVTFARNVGAQVAMPDPTEYQHTMQTLGLVEGMATALAAPLLGADALARARRINTDLAETLTHFDPVRFTALNREFHAELYSTCPNPHILDLVHRGWNRLTVLRESTFGFVPGRAAASVSEHEHLLDLIEGGATSLEIEFAARNHRLNTLEAFLASRDASPAGS